MTEAQKNKRRRSALYAPLSFILICAALVFGMSVFFRVSSIEVSGNLIYSAEAIIEASGIEPGDNLFFFNRSAATARIYSKLPYIELASTNPKLPNKIVIEVSESAAIACVEAEDGWWAIDRGCKLLSRVGSEDTADLIRVTGLVPIAPAEGDIIAPGEAERAKVTYLEAILKRIVALGMTPDVTEIDISGVSSPSFDYLGRFRVKLGSSDDLDYKFQLLLSAVSKLEPGDSGTLDLSIDKRAHLTYD